MLELSRIRSEAAFASSSAGAAPRLCNFSYWGKGIKPLIEVAHVGTANDGETGTGQELWLFSMIIAEILIWFGGNRERVKPERID